MTERTSMFILLNSSKQHQDPCYESPQKKYWNVIMSILFEQLKTKQYCPNHFESSFIVSVLPVPAGPKSNPP